MGGSYQLIGFGCAKKLFLWLHSGSCWFPLCLLNWKSARAITNNLDLYPHPGVHVITDLTKFSKCTNAIIMGTEILQD
jgi:hypothetical protein